MARTGGVEGDPPGAGGIAYGSVDGDAIMVYMLSIGFLFGLILNKGLIFI